MAWNVPYGWNAPAWGGGGGGYGRGGGGWNSGRGRGKGAKGPPARLLYVDGLLPECEDRDIREYFVSFGGIKEAFVSLEKDTTISRCFASLRFFDDVAAEKVLAGKHEIWGHEITVGLEAPNAEERPEFHGPATSAEPSEQLFGEAALLFYAMGLTEAVSDGVLREYFGKYGEVIECRVLALEADGTRPASIKMAAPSAAAEVVSKPVHDIGGTQVRVGREIVHVPAPKGADKGAGKKQGAPSSTQEAEVEPGKYVLSELAGDLVEQDIWDYFGVLGTIQEVTVQQDEQGRSTTGTVVFLESDDDEIKKFMLEQTHEIKGKAATVRESWRGGKKGGKAFKGGWGCGGKDGGQSARDSGWGKGGKDGGQSARDSGWGKGGWGKDSLGQGWEQRLGLGQGGGGFDKGCGKDAWAADPVLAVAKGGTHWKGAPAPTQPDGCGAQTLGKRGFGDGAAGAEPAGKFHKGEKGKKGKSFEAAMGFGFEQPKGGGDGGAPKGAYGSFAAPGGWNDGGGWGGAKGYGKSPKGWGGPAWS